MYFITTIKHIFSHHYPRNHVLLASVLSLLLLAVMALDSGDSGGMKRVVLSMPTHEASMATGAMTAGQPMMIPVPAQAPQASPDSATPAKQTPDDDVVAQNDESAEASPSSANPDWTRVEVRPGDNLSSLFTRVGLSASDLHRVLNNSSNDAGILNRLHPGYQLSFHIPDSGRLQQLQVLTSPLDGYRFTWNENRYEVEAIEREAEHVTAMRRGELSDSLFMSARRAEIPTSIIMEMADIFGGVIDFIMDPRRGDQFAILYEEKYLDGEHVGNGEVIGARFINRGREYVALRYQTEDGETGYFNPLGESMQKAFLRNPLDVFRISSDFNPNRRHPILNTIRAHKGTDYAAPRGTPIRATADGVVTRASRNGSFGNLVVIKHHGRFETKYAHLNSYGDGIRKGTRVEQGQVIGHVGATGSATGPHLHYEFLVGGQHKNPRTILDELPQAVTLEEKEMPRFREQTRDALNRLRQNDSEDRLLSYNSPNTAATQARE